MHDRFSSLTNTWFVKRETKCILSDKNETELPRTSHQLEAFARQLYPQFDNFTFLFKQELKKKTLTIHKLDKSLCFSRLFIFPAVGRTLSLYNYTGSYSWFLGSFSQWNLPKLQLTQEIALFPSMLSNFTEVTFITILGLPAKLHKVLLRVRKDNIIPASLPIPDKG